MEANQKLKIGIGTKEPEKLKPKKVVAGGIRFDEVRNKNDKVIGEKVTVICKHPDKEDPIAISSVEYKKDKALKISALWYNLDEEGLIAKNSALAQWMRHNGLENLDNIENKGFDTSQDDAGFLCFKAY